jgi:hypothetical protein
MIPVEESFFEWRKDPKYVEAFRARGRVPARHGDDPGARRTQCGKRCGSSKGLRLTRPGYVQQYAEFQQLMVYGSAAEYAAFGGKLQGLAMRPTDRARG